MCTEELPLPENATSAGVVYGDFAIKETFIPRSNDIDFTALQVSLNRDVVLKLVKPELAAKSEFADSFIDAAQAIAKLEHPFICPVYGVGEEENTCFLARGIGGGLTLKGHLLKNGTLSWQAGLRLVCDIADGLDHAWQEAKLTHMNLKPDYIMLGSKAHAQVADIGIAGLNPDPESERIIGTPQYISPERIVGMDGDNRSDIYSLGVTFYFMITGVFPFNAKNTNDIVTKHLQEFPKPANQLVPEIPAQLCSVIEMMLEKNPNMRYQSGRMLIEDLDAVLHDETPLHALKGGNIAPSSTGSHVAPKLAGVCPGSSGYHDGVSPNKSASGGTMKVRVEGKDKVKVLQLAGPNQNQEPSDSGAPPAPPVAPVQAAPAVSAKPVPDVSEQKEPDELDLLLEEFDDVEDAEPGDVDDDVLDADLDELLADENVPVMAPAATPPPARAVVQIDDDDDPPQVSRPPTKPVIQIDDDEPPQAATPAGPVVQIDDDDDDDYPEQAAAPPLAPPPMPTRRPPTQPVIQVDDDPEYVFEEPTPMRRRPPTQPVFEADDDDDDYSDVPKVVPRKQLTQRKTRAGGKKKFKTRVSMKRRGR